LIVYSIQVTTRVVEYYDLCQLGESQRILINNSYGNNASVERCTSFQSQGIVLVRMNELLSLNYI
jgi:hypothetical protein